MDGDKDFPDELLNAKVVFGLEAQGHIPTIVKMLEEKRTWDEIGDAIGWMGGTARYYYERWFWQRHPEAANAVSVDALEALARTVGVLEDLAARVPENETWTRNEIASAILMANKHLASKTTINVSRRQERKPKELE